MNLLKLQEKIKASIVDNSGNLTLEGLSLQLAMIQQDMAILHKQIEELEIKNQK